MSTIADQITAMSEAITGYGSALVTLDTALVNAINAQGNQITSLNETVGNISLVRGLFNSLELTATGLSSAVAITAAEMVLETSTNLLFTARNVNVTVNTGASGTAGTGANSLDTGNFAENTFYAVYVIYDSSSAATAGLLSLSATAPTLPAGYTYFTRVGWIRTDSTSDCHPLAFLQKGAELRWRVTPGSNLTALPQIASGAAGDTTIPTWVALPWANFAPSTTTELAILVAATGGSCTTMVAPNNAYGAWNSTTNPPPIMWSNEGTYISSVQSILLESADIFWASNPGAQPPTPGGTGNTGILSVAGWTDNI